MAEFAHAKPRGFSSTPTLASSRTRHFRGASVSTRYIFIRSDFAETPPHRALRPSRRRQEIDGGSAHARARLGLRALRFSRRRTLAREDALLRNGGASRGGRRGVRRPLLPHQAARREEGREEGDETLRPHLRRGRGDDEEARRRRASTRRSQIAPRRASEQTRRRRRFFSSVCV